MNKILSAAAAGSALACCLAVETFAGQPDTHIDVRGRYAGSFEGIYLVSLGKDKQLSLMGGQSLTVSTTETGDNGIRLVVTPVLQPEAYGWLAGKTALTGRTPYAYHMAFYRGDDSAFLLGEVILTLTIPPGYQDASLYYMDHNGAITPVLSQSDGNRLSFTAQNDGYYIFLKPFSSGSSDGDSDSNGSSGPPGTASEITIDGKKGYIHSSNGIITGATGSTARDGYSHWMLDSKGWRLRYADGTYASGKIRNQTEVYTWEKINGSWYVFGADGYALFGWVYDGVSGQWYYVDVNTGRKTGWHKDSQDGCWYYFDPVTGAMATGWKLIDGKWYYFNSIAAGQTWEYDGTNRTWRYLADSAGRPFGSMYQDERTPDGVPVDETGARMMK